MILPNRTMDNRYKKRILFQINNIQKIKFNRAPSITPVPTSKHITNVRITCNTRVKMDKFYHKATFSHSISIFIKSINAGHFAIWPNLTDNILQNNLPKITSIRKFHWDKVYQNIQLTKNFKPPELPIIEKYPESELIIK